jgi:putative nucleotidyltransferase with HDIG domain
LTIETIASRPETSAAAGQFRLSELLSALSMALDLTEGQAMGHSARSCVIGMRIADLIGLDSETRSDLFYALLLKDAGCSSNAARLATLFGADDRELKREHKLIDWAHLLPAAGFALRHSLPGAPVWDRFRRIARIAATAEEIGREMIAVRCERGADIVQMIGLSEATAMAIRNLDEHWDGAGHPAGLAGEAIPLLGRILCLAQTFEVFLANGGQRAAYRMARRRRGRWFDPGLVDALCQFERDAAFWQLIDTADPRGLVGRVEPAERVVVADERRVDQVAEAFAIIIDAKSPYTYRHSAGVAAIAETTGRALGMDDVTLRELRRAALLHDIGKLAVSNEILDKSGKLTDAEWTAMRQHPAHTHEILAKVARFRDLAEVAAAHHERLDGTGYHRGLVGGDLSLPARVLAVADICEALQAERPYRAGMPPEAVEMTMRKSCGTGICETAFEALREHHLRR